MSSLNRSTKYGPGAVARFVLGLIDRQPFGARDEITPVIDVRGLRPWELYNENIERYGVGGTQTLTAGEFSGFAIIPRVGYITYIPWVKLVVAATYSVRLDDVADIASYNPFTVGTNHGAPPLDGRIGPELANLVRGIRGTSAAQAGNQLFKIGGAAGELGGVQPLDIVINPPGYIRPTGTALLVYCNTPATGADFSFPVWDIPIGES